MVYGAAVSRRARLTMWRASADVMSGRTFNTAGTASSVWTMSNWSLLTLLKTTVLSGIIFLISGPMAARADWRVQSSTDAITDREEKIAEVHNQRGYRFGVYRVEGGQVFAVFALPSSLVGSIDHDRPMHLRIDQNKPHERGGPFAREWEQLGGRKHSTGSRASLNSSLGSASRNKEFRGLLMS